MTMALSLQMTVSTLHQGQMTAELLHIHLSSYAHMHYKQCHFEDKQNHIIQKCMYTHTHTHIFIQDRV